MMMMILLLLLFPLFSSGSFMPSIWDESCSYTRADVLHCIRQHLDTNRDNKIAVMELEIFTRTRFTPLRWFMDRYMKTLWADCDFNRDGTLTLRDWKLSEKTCFPHKRSWCTAQWFCDKLDNK